MRGGSSALTTGMYFEWIAVFSCTQLTAGNGGFSSPPYRYLSARQVKNQVISYTHEHKRRACNLGTRLVLHPPLSDRGLPEIPDLRTVVAREI